MDHDIISAQWAATALEKAQRGIAAIDAKDIDLAQIFLNDALRSIRAAQEVLRGYDVAREAMKQGFTDYLAGHATAPGWIREGEQRMAAWEFGQVKAAEAEAELEWRLQLEMFPQAQAVLPLSEKLQ
jgi:hypothetical protein